LKSAIQPVESTFEQCFTRANRDVFVEVPPLSHAMWDRSAEGNMCHRSASVLIALLGLVVGGAHAQDTRKAAPPSPVAANAPHDQKSGRAVDLSPRQAELVRQVNGYFNQLTIIKGSFIQTGADNKRQRGKFYIMRPGRFRFEFSPPSKVVIIADGQSVAIQDHDLKTDDRWDLSYTPFRALLQKDVNLLRDAHIFEVHEDHDTIAIAFEDKTAEASSRIKLFLATQPVLHLKAWIAKDAQGFDTRTDLIDVTKIDSVDQQLFNPAAASEQPR
jgi:outer membrane lipoprotein-sorting protein